MFKPFPHYRQHDAAESIGFRTMGVRLSLKQLLDKLYLNNKNRCKYFAKFNKKRKFARNKFKSI